MRTRFPRRAAAAAAVVLLALAALSACGSHDEDVNGSQGAVSIEGGEGDSTADRAFQDLGDSPQPAPAGSVANDDGSTWRYRGAVTGKVTLLYFGYTNCPDVCPTTMADIASALAKLPASVSDRVDVQMVTTDPARDTEPVIKRWLAGFDPSFRGGRAPIADVVAQARAYGIGITPPKVSKDDYQVTHGSQVLVLEPGGGEVGYFRALVGPEGYEAVLPKLVRTWA